MGAVLALSAISVLVGLLLGFLCLPWRLIVIPNLMIAVGSIAISLEQTFGVFGATAFLFGCLSLAQIAYVVGAAILVFSDPKAFVISEDDDYPGASHLQLQHLYY